VHAHLQAAHAERELGQRFQTVERQLQAHFEEQEEHPQLAESLDILGVF
jgi:hypothetical protein